MFLYYFYQEVFYLATLISLYYRNAYY
ncbi:hypothetical protein KKC1_15180 [Calderihabitans maritimus]|uniref:Uncharacterized protein n=1 Tax=Calderihabitans maritimus TaxID=1246530 RepID=A0A1Z5HS64_9FIRM|nr:hypothetical protein KKC1_15180 [Calderihabitans maritimus]